MAAARRQLVMYHIRNVLVNIVFHSYGILKTARPGSEKFSATTPIFCTFSVEPLVIYNCALYIIENSRTVFEIFDF